MKLKNLAVLLIAAVMTVMLYTLGATVYSAGDGSSNNDSLGHNGHSVSDWTSLKTGTEITASGNYYLEGNVEISSITISKNDLVVNLCLNGHKLDLGTGSIQVTGRRVTLNICNCKNEVGTIYTKNSNRCINIQYSASALNVTGTNITIQNDVASAGSACIYVTQDGAITHIGDENSKNIEIIGGQYGIHVPTGTNCETYVSNAKVTGGVYGISFFGNLTVKDSTIIGGTYGIYSQGNNSGNKIDISNTEISADYGEENIAEKYGIYCSKGTGVATITIEGSTVSNVKYGIASAADSKINLEITDSDIKGDDYGIYFPLNSNSASPAYTAAITLNKAAITGRSYGIYCTGGKDSTITIPEKYVYEYEDSKYKYVYSYVKIDNCDTGIYIGGSTTLTIPDKKVTIPAGVNEEKIESPAGNFYLDIDAEKYGIQVNSGTLDLGAGTVSGKINGVRIDDDSASTHFNLSGSPNINCSDNNGANIQKALPREESKDPDTLGDVKTADVIADIYLEGHKSGSSVQYAYITIIGELGSVNDKGEYVGDKYTLYANCSPRVFTNTQEDEDHLTFNDDAAEHEIFRTAAYDDYIYAVTQNTARQLMFKGAINVTFDYYGNMKDKQSDPESPGYNKDADIQLNDNVTFQKYISDDEDEDNAIDERFDDREFPIAFNSGTDDLYEPAGFYWKGYHFLGWYTTDGLGEDPGKKVEPYDIVSEIFVSTDTGTLYARWEECSSTNQVWVYYDAQQHICGLCRTPSDHDYQLDEVYTRAKMEDEENTEDLYFAGCVTEGYAYFTCVDCGHTKDKPQIYDPTGHDLDEEKWEYKDETGHWHPCKNGCGMIVDPKAHDAPKVDEGTCIKKKTSTYDCECDFKETVKGELNFEVHSWINTKWVSGTYWEYDKTKDTDDNDDIAGYVEKEDTSQHWHECEWCHDRKDLSGEHERPTDESKITTIPANCVDKGSVLYDCDLCGEPVSITLEVDPNAHVYLNSPNWDYSDSDGHWYYCQKNKEHKQKFEDHSYPEEGKGERIKDPTCQDLGTDRYTCTDPRCNEYHDEDVPTVDHKFGEWKHDESLPEHKGEHWHECTYDCGTTESEPHDDPEPENVGSCVEKKIVSYDCKCGYKDTVVEGYNFDNHKWNEDAWVTGEYWYYDKDMDKDRDDDEYDDEYYAENSDLPVGYVRGVDTSQHWHECEWCHIRLKPEDHVPDESTKQTVLPATCVSEGLDSYICKLCKEPVEQETPVDDEAHKYEPVEKIYDDKGHWYVCQNAPDDPDHYKFEDHDYTVEHTIPPTCTEKGTDTYTCTDEDCGKSYTKDVDEIEHTWGDEWKYEDPEPDQVGKHWHECIYCGARGEAEAHWSSEPPYHDDLGKDGYHWSECTACGQEYGREEHNFRLSKTILGNCKEGKETIDVYECEQCDVFYEESQGIVHDFSGEYGFDPDDVDAGHWQLCIRCGEKPDELSPHTFNRNQRTLPGSCDERSRVVADCICGAAGVLSEGDFAHQFGGEYYCTVDEDGNETDEGHWQWCEICGEAKSDVSKHVYGSGVETEDGYIEYTCTLCGHIHREEKEPEDTEPEDTEPEDTEPEDTKPEDTKPEDTKPEDTKPEDTKPEDTKPEDTKPEDTKPEDTQPEDTKPEDTNPEDTKPEDTNPEDTTTPEDTTAPDDDVVTETGGTTEPEQPPIDDPPGGGDDGDDTSTETSTDPSDSETTTTGGSSDDTTTPPEVTSSSSTSTTRPPVVTTSETTTDVSDDGSGSVTTTEEDPVSTGTVVGSGKVIVVVIVEDGAPNIHLSSETLEQLEQEVIDNHLTDEEKLAIQNGGIMEIVLTVKNIDGSVPDENQQLIDAFLASSLYREGQYNDISIVKMLNGQYVGNITQLSTPIAIKFDIPERLKRDNRIYALLRVHDGAVEQLNDLDSYAYTLTVESDKFSTYVIVYLDTAGNDAHYTGSTGGTNDASGTNNVNGTNSTNNTNGTNNANGTNSANAGKPNNPNTGSPLKGIYVFAFIYPTVILAAAFSKKRTK